MISREKVQEATDRVATKIRETKGRGLKANTKVFIRVEARRLRIPSSDWADFFKNVGQELSARADVAGSTAA